MVREAVAQIGEATNRDAIHDRGALIETVLGIVGIRRPNVHIHPYPRQRAAQLVSTAWDAAVGPGGMEARRHVEDTHSTSPAVRDHSYTLRALARILTGSCGRRLSTSIQENSPW